MALKLKHRVYNGMDDSVCVAVHYDSDYREYRCRTVAPRGQINHDTDYFTNDVHDAISTAKFMVGEVCRAIGVPHLPEAIAA